MEHQEFEKLKFEYDKAQEMLRHYDTLNWQIGSILIAATLVLTGLVLKAEIIDIIQSDCLSSWVIVCGIPAISAFILITWLYWFNRHRSLYNFRNETLHRLELKLGMYHFLRIVEADPERKKKQDVKTVLEEAKHKAGYGEQGFVPFYRLEKLQGPPGYILARIFAFGMPLFQFLLLLSIKYI